MLTFWATFNNITAAPTTTAITEHGTTIERTRHEGEDGIAVEHYKVLGGGHVWFDLSYEGADTNRLIWDFVSRYDLSGLRD